MTTTPVLPDLPKPLHYGPSGTGSYFNSYTSDQMREYAIAAAQAAQTEPTIGDWVSADDVLRNVKRLDDALNGQGGAARPLLVDILGQVEQVAREIGMPVLSAVKNHGVAAQAIQNVPLTRAQIEAIVINVCDQIYPQDGASYSEADSVFYGAFARAIEAAHNITPATGTQEEKS